MLPEASIDAIDALLVVHVPPVAVFDIIDDTPTQTKLVPVMAGGMAVTVTFCVTKQPVVEEA